MPKKFPEEFNRDGVRVARRGDLTRAEVAADVDVSLALHHFADPPLKLVLIAIPGKGGSPNHLGVEVADTVVVEAGQARLAEAGFAARPE